MAYKGKYRPVNVSKYKGDVGNIVYRSLWERQVMKYMDFNPSVILWASEEIYIPYVSPVDGERHKYYVDFWAQIKTKTDDVQTVLIEVKPWKQTQPPKMTKRTVRYLRESETYAINQAKFEAARLFCEEKGWKFVILTEKELRANK